MAQVTHGALFRRVLAVALGGLVVGCQATRGAEHRASEDAGPQVAHQRVMAPSVMPARLSPAVRADIPVSAKEPCALAADLERVELPELEEGGVSTSNLMAWVGLLAGPALHGREAGTRDAQVAAYAIAEFFESIALVPRGTSGYCTRFGVADMRDQNVVGHLPPVNPNACGHVVLGAHYDGLGVDKRGHIRPGADDNASGVAVLVEAARLLALDPLPDVGVVFASFGAEEQGYLGAKAYAMRPSVPLDTVLLMINVDMAGRRPSGYPTIGYQVFGPERRGTDSLVRGASQRSGVVVTQARLGARGDHAAFAASVPAVFLSTMTHADYHGPNDTAERVEPAQVAATLRLVLELVRSVGCPVQKGVP